MTDNDAIDRLMDLPSIHEAINSAVVEFLAGQPGEGLLVEFVAAADLTQAETSLIMPNGRTESISGNRLLNKLLRRLRAVMATSEHGTWYSMKLTAASGDGPVMSFNYDNKPDWSFDLPDEVYIEDNKMFPRPANELPSWHPAKA